MKPWMLVLLPSLLAVGLSLSIGFWVVRQARKKRIGRRTPITGLLLRSPGQSLLPQIEDLSDEINSELMGIFFVPPLMFGMLISELYFGILKATLSNIALIVLVSLFFVLYCARRMSRQIERRDRLRLGYDCELAVGQELNHLMLHGCRVFHDFPAENFNIDHVVVGPGGVIAVETKGRAKPDKNRGSVDATVIYDGQILRFPDWHETQPLEQAKRQADWLQKWLNSAIGESVQVKPALALPGWFVERTKPGSVFIFNGKNPIYLAKPLDSSAPLAPQMIQRIAHQLEQRCRDVEPVAYRKVKKYAKNA